MDNLIFNITDYSRRYNYRRFLRNITYNNYNDTPFFEKNNNRFLPVYLTETQLLNKNDDSAYHVYAHNIPNIDTYIQENVDNLRNNYTRLINIFINYGNIDIKMFVNHNQEDLLYVLPGLLLSLDNKILALLVSKTIGEPYQDINAHNFKLHVSTELLINEKYALFIKQFDKRYIRLCYENNIPVEIHSSDDIVNSVFVNRVNDFSKMSLMETITLLQSNDFIKRLIDG